jgi:hypothetical protein
MSDFGDYDGGYDDGGYDDGGYDHGDAGYGGDVYIDGGTDVYVDGGYGGGGGLGVGLGVCGVGLGYGGHQTTYVTGPSYANGQRRGPPPRGHAKPYGVTVQPGVEVEYVSDNVCSFGTWCILTVTFWILTAICFLVGSIFYAMYTMPPPGDYVPKTYWYVSVGSMTTGGFLMLLSIIFSCCCCCCNNTVYVDDSSDVSVEIVVVR